MSRPLRLALVVPALVACFACGLTIGGTKRDQTIPSGSQTYTPGTSGTGGGTGGSTAGTGGSSSTTGPAVTSVACATSADCAYWYCRCNDGMVVNAAYCYQRFCAEASGICPDACATFNHGAWTGAYNGGPTTTGGTGGSTGTGGSSGTGGGSSGGCTQSSDCTPWDCVCHDGTIISSRTCTNHVCEGETATCTVACSDNGGYP